MNSVGDMTLCVTCCASEPGSGFWAANTRLMEWRREATPRHTAKDVVRVILRHPPVASRQTMHHRKGDQAQVRTPHPPLPTLPSDLVSAVLLPQWHRLFARRRDVFLESESPRIKWGGERGHNTAVPACIHTLWANSVCAQKMQHVSHFKTSVIFRNNLFVFLSYLCFNPNKLCPLYKLMNSPKKGCILISVHIPDIFGGRPDTWMQHIGCINNRHIIMMQFQSDIDLGDVCDINLLLYTVIFACTEPVYMCICASRHQPLSGEM